MLEHGGTSTTVTEGISTSSSAGASSINWPFPLTDVTVESVAERLRERVRVTESSNELDRDAPSLR